MIPYSHRRERGRARSVALVFSYGVIVLPVILIYTISVYRIFRGKSHHGYR
jgi:cytochrome bd-type quinol oxidase subunit 2